jgi:GDPmannose 4,6-dehydratase
MGSTRTNSVLSYVLLSLEKAGFEIDKIETPSGKKVSTPTERDYSEIFGVEFEKTKVDKLMLMDGLNFNLDDGGILVHTNVGKIKVEFDEKRFRPADVPILISDSQKIKKLGFRINYKIDDIVKDQLNYFMKKENRV